VKQNLAIKGVGFMQKLRTLTETKLLDIFPIGENHDLPSRDDMDAHLKDAIGCTYKDVFEIPDEYMKEIEDNWRLQAADAFMEYVAGRMFFEKKELEELSLDRNRAFQKK